MLADNGEQHFPEAADDKHHGVDRQEVTGAQHHLADPASVGHQRGAEPLRQAIMPVARQHLLQLVAAVQMVQRRIACWPTLYMPQNIAGNTASHTRIIMRFKSMASRTCEAPRVTVPGV